MEPSDVLDHESLLNGHQEHALVVLNNVGPGCRQSRDDALLIRLWRTASFVVVADGAANHITTLFKYGISAPSVVCGDFDSIEDIALNTNRDCGSAIICLDSQDHTDLQKSVQVVACHSLGIPLRTQSVEVRDELPLDVVVFGAFGGRFDHEMGAIHELYRAQHWFRSMTLLSDCNLACLIRPGRTAIKCHEQLQRSSTCGLLPLAAPVRSVSTKGLRWDLSQHGLRLGSFVSTSNCIVGDVVEIECSDPVVWTTSLQRPPTCPP